jgi:hypothetical protein
LAPDQVDVFGGAIAAASRLKYLDMDMCYFANDGSLEQIAVMCTKVEHIVVTYVIFDFTSQYSALSKLLRDNTLHQEYCTVSK